MTTFVFPGQGSQTKGMGGNLFEEFKEITAQADEILGYSIKRLCMEDPNLQLGQTLYTQPALFTVNALSYLKKIQDSGVKPDFVAGHSLGEYNALFAAGIFDFATGLKIVQKRGELMSQAVGGGMMAVLGLDERQLTEVIKEKNFHTIEIANYNSPYQIVVSGPKNDIERSKTLLEGIPGVKMIIPLKTSGAFHSRYMEEAQRKFEIFIDPFQFQKLTISVISNVFARPYQYPDIKQLLIKQITHPVKWTETIQYLMGLGEMVFEEIGPGKVLSGLIQRIKKDAPPLVSAKEPSAAEMVAVTSDNETLTTASEKEDATVVNSFQQPLHVFPEITAFSLGCSEFKQDYHLKYAYLTGGMYRGVASPDLVIKMGKAGMMGFYGAGGLELSRLEEGIRQIQEGLAEGQAYGVNLVHNLMNPNMEEQTIDLFLALNVRVIEAAAFLTVSPALVRYRAKGLRMVSGKTVTENKIIAKISRPEVAEAFLSPAPEKMIEKLLAQNTITAQEAAMLRKTPMADDICVEADSGGHTDGGVAYVLMPALQKLRDEMMEKYHYDKRIRVGAAGGIGTPEAAVAAFMMGADFIVTGSINQCTVEAATSDAVKDLLQQINVQDTDYAPAGDMFELGAKVQVLKKGLFFSARANKLYDLYRQYNSLQEIDEKTKVQIQNKYFKRSFEKVYEEVKSFCPAGEIEKAEKNPKHKMALIFRWYFGYSTRLALAGNEESKVDYQVHCGPALGAFNQWVKDTHLESWQNRHGDEIGLKIMSETAELINHRYRILAG